MKVRAPLRWVNPHSPPSQTVRRGVTVNVDEPLRVLMVCWGNICRSPTAEGILRHLAAEKGMAIQVDSAGTSDEHRGSPPDRRAIAEAAKRGIDISGQRSRQIQRSDFEEFDLILTADEMVDQRVRGQAPVGSRARIERMTYPLPDFDRYPEVPDPYYGNAANYRDVYALLERSMGALLESLEPHSSF